MLFILKKSIMCVANLHAVCFLHCGILLYSKMRQSLTIYIMYFFICFWCSFMKVMSKIIILRNITIFSLQFVQKMCPSCKINVCIFFHLCTMSCVYLRGVSGCERCHTFGTEWILEDHVAAVDRWRSILNSDAYFFPAP